MSREPSPALFIAREPTSAGSRRNRVYRIRLWLMILMLLLTHPCSLLLFQPLLLHCRLSGPVLDALGPAASPLGGRRWFCRSLLLHGCTALASHRGCRADQHSQFDRTHPHGVHMLCRRVVVFMFCVRKIGEIRIVLRPEVIASGSPVRNVQMIVVGMVLRCFREKLRAWGSCCAARRYRGRSSSSNTRLVLRF
ncbi:hypothetical protein FN846DRAFT_20179 [Sphaerosporella brunnea]|uniref:Uncharacterized protein n=1 Tax=Sphaerosporella brunnea TaxID=1250544 RepID=A0A5J5EV67_9PEZI|nr:hypothetical protein FN846DRAFT_20179 [Sphaerosporella brunnea]